MAVKLRGRRIMFIIYGNYYRKFIDSNSLRYSHPKQIKPGLRHTNIYFMTRECSINRVDSIK